MPHKILICGANGAGKSTLGRALAAATGWKFMDAEDYFFTDSSYEAQRSRDEVRLLLKSDMQTHRDFIFASVKGNYGDDIISLFTCAVYLDIAKHESMRRIYRRSREKFGGRMLPGGDMYEKETAFFDMVLARPENEVACWLESAGLNVIYLDGALPVSENLRILLRKLEAE